MKHQISCEDYEYLRLFERCKIKPETFGHHEHIRIAYILLTKLSVEEALSKLRGDLMSFLDYIGTDKSKYHETLTQAWLLAVNHFMHISSPVTSFNEFIDSNNILSNKEIMYTHYSSELIESDKARIKFVQPDLEPIPRY